jgi:hypothetical protein
VWVFVTSQRVAMRVFSCGCSDLCWVFACCRREGVDLWPVGIKEGVKDCVGVCVLFYKQYYTVQVDSIGNSFDCFSGVTRLNYR